MDNKANAAEKGTANAAKMTDTTADTTTLQALLVTEKSGTLFFTPKYKLGQKVWEIFEMHDSWKVFGPLTIRAILFRKYGKEPGMSGIAYEVMRKKDSDCFSRGERYLFSTKLAARLEADEWGGKLKGVD